MALSNFSLPFGGLASPWSVTLAPPLHAAHQLATNTNNLLYSPADHQQQQNDEEPPPVGSDFYKNNPYAPPQMHQPQTAHKQVFHIGTNNYNRRKGGNTYLPPIPAPGTRNSQFYHHQQQAQQTQQTQDHHQYNNNNNNRNELYKTTVEATATDARTYGEGSYNNYAKTEQKTPQQQQSPTHQYFNTYNTRTNAYNHQQQQQQQQQQMQGATRRPAATYGVSALNAGGDNNNANGISINNSKNNNNNNKNNDGNSNDNNSDYPERPPGFTRVQAGQGSRTQVHAVLDYDVEEGEEDEYYDAEDHTGDYNKKIKEEKRKKADMPLKLFVSKVKGLFTKNDKVDFDHI